MCIVQLPPGGNPLAVNKYISYITSYLIMLFNNKVKNSERQMLKKRQIGAWEYLAAMLEYVVLEYKSQLYYSLRIGTQVVTIMSGC
jgi:hypothetical protein